MGAAHLRELLPLADGRLPRLPPAAATCISPNPHSLPLLASDTIFHPPPHHPGARTFTETAEAAEPQPPSHAQIPEHFGSDLWMESLLTNHDEQEVGWGSSTGPHGASALGHGTGAAELTPAIHIGRDDDDDDDDDGRAVGGGGGGPRQASTPAIPIASDESGDRGGYGGRGAATTPDGANLSQ